MVDLRRFFRRDRFAAHAGARLLSVSPGRARARMRLSERHLNGVDVAQGGAIFTLADLAFAAAANSHGTVAVAVNVAISFVKAAVGGTLTAEAREVARSARLSTCVVRVTDASGDLVALFNGTAYRKREALGALPGAGTARAGGSAAERRRRRAR
jgi:acyl-CoA thioesterase